MTLAPLATAPPAILIHLATVIPAFAIGTWLIFFSTKGRYAHRMLGAIYLVLMTLTAIAAFFIRSVNPGHLTLIHLFIPLTLVSVFGALWFIRRGNIKGHRYAMIGLYVGGIILAGGFAFVPGRLMHTLIFG